MKHKIFTNGKLWIFCKFISFPVFNKSLQKKRLKRNDEILIPALCWSTSLWPIVQSGLKPKFVDIDIETLNINLKDLEKKITKKTKAIMLVHVLETVQIWMN